MEEMRFEYPKKDNNVLIVTKDNYQQVLQYHPNILFMFYAERCKKSKLLAPKYAETAQKVMYQRLELKLAKIDALVESEIAKMYKAYPAPYSNIYPIFILQRENSILNYSGPHEMADLLEWVTRKVYPAKELSSIDDVKNFIDSHSFVIIGFFNSTKSNESNEYLKIADTLDHYNFGITDNQYVLQKYNVITSKKIILFRKYDRESASIYDDELTIDKLNDFIKINSLKLSFIDTVDGFIGTNDVAIIGLFQNIPSETVRLFIELAETMKHLAFRITCNPEILQKYNATTERVILFKKFDEGQSIYGNNPIDFKELSEFINIYSRKLVVDFNHDLINEIFTSIYKRYLYILRSKSAGDFDLFIDSIKTSARIYRGKIMFVVFNADSGEDKKFLGNLVGLEENELTPMIFDGSYSAGRVIEKSGFFDVNNERIGEFISSIVEPDDQQAFTTTADGYQRRVRRSESELKKAARMVERGLTFKLASDKWNIPISTIRFYMSRKGLLERKMPLNYVPSIEGYEDDYDKDDEEEFIDTSKITVENEEKIQREAWQEINEIHYFFSTEKSYNLMEILPKCGQFITTFDLGCNPYGILPLIIEHCQNLKTLKIEINNLLIRELSSEFLKLKNLESIKIRSQEELVADYFIKFLDNLPQTIQEIHITGCKNYFCPGAFPWNGNFSLQKFTELRCLTINRYVLNESLIDDISKLQSLVNLNLAHNVIKEGIYLIGNLKNLKHLEIQRVHSVDDNFIINLVNNSTRLYYLNLSGCKLITNRGFDELKKLDNLTILFLNKTAIFDDEISQLVHLKRLHCRFCVNICNNGIAKFLVNCPGIEELRICHSSTNKDIIEFVDNFMGIRNSKEPLLLIVNVKMIYDEINNEYLQTTSPLLHVKTSDHIDSLYSN